MAVSTRGNGPTMYDVWFWTEQIAKSHRVAVSLVMESQRSSPGVWVVKVVAQTAPTTETARLRSATGTPSVTTVELLWSEKSNLDLASSLFRCLFELEIQVIEMLTQLELPI